jgi:hypothetical protein
MAKIRGRLSNNQQRVRQASLGHGNYPVFQGFGPDYSKSLSALQRGNDERVAGVNRWAGICERLTAALRGWPTSEIEHAPLVLQS